MMGPMPAEVFSFAEAFGLAIPSSITRSPTVPMAWGFMWKRLSWAQTMICAVRAGDILLNRTNSPDLVGKVGLVERDMAAVFASYLVRLSVDPAQIRARFLSYWLSSSGGQRQIRPLATRGVSQANINPSVFCNEVKVPVPPIEEQDRIAELLCIWDKTLVRLARQIEGKETLLESFRERLIHGAHRLGGRKSPWPMVSLSEVTRQLTERNGTRYDRDLVMGVTKAEGIVPMREHVVAEDISRYLVLPPSGFAYNPMRINIGSIAMSEHEDDVIVSPDYVVFACKIDRLHPRFLNHLRRTKAWADYMTIAGNGSVRVRIYYASLAEFEFHLPPLDEQRAIVEVLDDAEREIAVLEAEQAALSRQRDALATELLTGRLRVPQAEVAS